MQIKEILTPASPDKILKVATNPGLSIIKLMAFCLFFVCFGANKGWMRQEIQTPKNDKTEKVTAIRDVRIFDGIKVIPRGTVLFSKGVITAVGADVRIPQGAEIVEGHGKTLLPGLIDAHVHAFPGDLERALLFGVTTELDMGAVYPQIISKWHDEQKEGHVYGRADIFSAGFLTTAPGGHGTEYGVKIPTIGGPEEAQDFVDARIAEGSDYIKIIYDDGTNWGPRINTISWETMKAVVDAAHKRSKLAVAHAMTLREATDALKAGVNGLAHIFADEMPDKKFAKTVLDRGAFVIPTLVVFESLGGAPSGTSLVKDNRLAPFLSQAEESNLVRAFPQGSKNDFNIALKVVGMLKEVGVPLLAGTDSPNPGTAHGVSIHRELELLVRAGLKPTEALAAATSVPARIFGLRNRGRIASGFRADLLLVKGDPTSDITMTRDIVAVWKEGVSFKRLLAQKPTAPTISPFEGESGLVSNFDDGKLGSFFGCGWQVSTDQMLGGKSTAGIKVVEGGSEGSPYALQVKGNIAPGAMYKWAGAMFFPGSKPMAPVDLSRFKQIVFWAKGEGKNYRIMLYAERFGYIPLQKGFLAGAEWKQFIFPLAEFSQFDGKGLMGILFTGGPDEGDFTLLIDNIEFR
jgi:imidazolonepropionase-like amidohydrolase